MARPSRAERRRMASRTTTAPQSSTPTTQTTTPVEPTPAVVTSSDAASQPSRLIRSTRRLAANPQARVYNQSAEYAVIAHDLKRIALWGSILIAIMVALKVANIF